MLLPAPDSVATIKGLVARTAHSRLVLFSLLILAASCLAGCAVSLGPGYAIDKQELQVRFTPDPQPIIHIDAEYHLRNNGNQPLTTLELRLPGRRRFRFAAPRVEWDSHTVALVTSPDNPRNVAINFSEPWPVNATHTMHLAVEYQPFSSNEGASSEHSLSFASDAFFLPAEGWSPQLIPARGAFATGGIPPDKWFLTLRVPEGFLVHMSGRQSKPSRSGQEQTIRAEQRPSLGYPFIVAGHYTSFPLQAGQETVNLWSRTPQSSADLRPAADALIRTLQTYSSMFGNRTDDSHQLWIVECPVVASCFTSTASNYAGLVSENNAKPSAEMASADTVMADFAAGPPEIAAGAAPSLASSWLGYGQNPGFYEQDPPLAALPAFAAARGREAVQGPQVRTETIRRLLRIVPVGAAVDSRKPEDDSIVRARSLLFFYGLQDRYGPDACNKALSHMLYARRGGGFNLTDLISAFEQEAHQNVAEFVRHWMKRPGVPDEFRARYAVAASNAGARNAVDATYVNSKETTP
jgi:hypothetical protein